MPGVTLPYGSVLAAGRDCAGALSSCSGTTCSSSWSQATWCIIYLWFMLQVADEEDSHEIVDGFRSLGQLILSMLTLDTFVHICI